MSVESIALRNKLYALMRQCLDDPGRMKEWGDLPSTEKNLKYQAALKEWLSQEPPAENFLKALAFSEILFNRGLFFDTHEYLEEAWNAAQHDRKICLQGLIQIAAGFHKLELDPKAVAGALELLTKGLEKLHWSRDVLGEATVIRIARALDPVLASLRQGKGNVQAPSLQWS